MKMRTAIQRIKYNGGEVLKKKKDNNKKFTIVALGIVPVISR